LANAVAITVEYDTPNEKGTTKRRYMAQVGSKAPVAEVNPLAGYLMDAFWRISSERHNTGFGISRLSSASIVAWASSRGVVFQEWEIDCIQAMDAAFIREAGRRNKNG
jgi:hypothetical protein